MNRQRAGDELERSIRKLRADGIPESPEWHRWARGVEAGEMEEDARAAIGGDQHSSAAMNLWVDEHAHVHDGDEEERRMPTDTGSPARSAPKVEMLALAQVKESPGNPRKIFHGIEELAADVKLRGILQPVLVRPIVEIVADGRGERHNGYEIVFGARRFRAAQLAKLDALPAFVRPMTDEEVLEVQLVENSKREDIHPLEEADGYCILHEKYGRSVEEIAAKVGKSRSAVYERIKLCALVPAARSAFIAGKLSASTALLVARIPDKELQVKAAKDLVDLDGEPMPYRAAVDFVQRTYMLQLKDAPFDAADAKLVAKAGACTTCPKRTGNQAEIFGDVKSPDVCTDPGCYQGKVDAVWKLKVVKAKETGQEILDEKKSKELFKYGSLSYGSGFVDLDQEEYDGNRNKRVRTIVGKEVQPVLARDPQGRIHELVKREVLEKALRARQPHHKAGKAEIQERERTRKAAEKLGRDLKLRQARAAALIREVVAKLEKAASKGAWFILAEALLDDEFEYSHGETKEIFVHLLGHEPRSDYKKDHADLHKLLSGMKQEQLIGFVFELSLHRCDAFHKLVRGEKGPISELVSALGIDEKKVVERVKMEIASKEPRGGKAKKSAAAT